MFIYVWSVNVDPVLEAARFKAVLTPRIRSGRSSENQWRSWWIYAFYSTAFHSDHSNHHHKLENGDTSGMGVLMFLVLKTIFISGIECNLEKPPENITSFQAVRLSSSVQL